LCLKTLKSIKGQWESMTNRSNGKTLIIAEAGVNHNGSLDLAKQLATVAKDAGADVVKFQAFKSEALVSKQADKADYQKATTDSDESQYEMLKKLELSYEDFAELKRYCDSIGIEFSATAFDQESTRFLVEDIGISFIKVPSGELNDYPYLVQSASYGLPIIASCGMATLSEIEAALNVLKEHGAKSITLLHCNTQYPTPYEDVNLLVLDELHHRLGIDVGYSDHTPGIEVPIAAVALGACVIEKHFTLDKTMQGPDHLASLDPYELQEMVSSIRHIEQARGSSEKQVTVSEEANRKVARRSIVAKRDISAGELFSEENLTTKRPGDGLDPMLWPTIVGTKAVRSFKADEKISL